MSSLKIAASASPRRDETVRIARLLASAGGVAKGIPNLGLGIAVIAPSIVQLRGEARCYEVRR